MKKITEVEKRLKSIEHLKQAIKQRDIKIKNLEKDVYRLEALYQEAVIERNFFYNNCDQTNLY